MLDDAAPAVASNEPQSLWRHLAVLHVEQLQLAAVGCQSFESSARDALARSEAHSPQALAVHGQLLQPAVWHQRALPHVQRLESGAAPGQVAQAVVCQPLATPRVQVAQSRAVARHVAHAHVSDAGAVGHAQVAQAALQAGHLAQAEVPHQAAVAETKLPDWRAVEGQVAQGLIRQSGAAAQIQMCQARAVGGDSSQTLVLEGKTISHVQEVDGDLLAVQRGQLEGGLLGEADAGHLGAAWRESKQRLESFDLKDSDTDFACWKSFFLFIKLDIHLLCASNLMCGGRNQASHVETDLHIHSKFCYVASILQRTAVKSLESIKVCTPDELSGSVQRVGSRALVDWMNCGFGLNSALADFPQMHPQSLQVCKSRVVIQTFGRSPG